MDNSNNSENFDLIIKQPIAAGSICNIYLVNFNKKKAILKIKHNNLLNSIENSIKEIKLLEYLFSWFSKKNIFSLIDIQSVREMLLLQLNLANEAESQIKIKNNIESDLIQVPKIYNYTNDYIIMEYLEGYKFNDFIEKFPDYDHECIALLYCSLCKMIKTNKIHGDLHGGNFYYKFEDDILKIIVLDYGITCNLTDIQSKYIFRALNMKISKIERNKAFIQFVYSIDDNIKNELSKYDIQVNSDKDQDYIINLIIKNNILIKAEFISFFTTFQMLVININQRIKKSTNFEQYLIGFAMENDIL